MAATHPESTDTGPHDTNRPDTEAGRESVFSLPLASLSPGDLCAGWPGAGRIFEPVRASGCFTARASR